MRALPALAVSLSLAAVACVSQTPAPASPQAASRAVVAVVEPTPVAPPRPLVLPTLVPAPTPTRPAATAAPVPRATAAAPQALQLQLTDGVLPDPNDAYAVVLEDLHTGARLAVNDQRVFPSASLYKLGVAWAVLRQSDAGSIHLDEPLLIEPEDAVEPEPAGGVGPGDSPSVGGVLGVMLSVSSNAAAHALLRTIGRHAFNLEMNRIGLRQTRVPENVAEDGTAGDEMAVTSASDIARLLRLMTTQELSGAARAELMHGLATSAPPDPLRETLPEGVDILDKTGNLEDASDIGALLISGTSAVILVVLDQGVDPGDARGMIAQLGHAAYEAVLQPN